MSNEVNLNNIGLQVNPEASRLTLHPILDGEVKKSRGKFYSVTLVSIILLIFVLLYLNGQSIYMTGI